MDSKANSIDLYSCYGYHSGHCGYCDSKNGHYTCGFTSQLLKPEIYQAMMDRGWRRCGTLYYKPDNVRQCCKMYTIRLEANTHKIRNSHHKTMKRFQKYLDGYDVRNKEGTEESKDEEDLVDKVKKNDISLEGPRNEDLEKIEAALNSLLQKIKSEKNTLGGLFSPNKSLLISEGLENSQKATKSTSKKFGDFTSPLLLKLFGENKKELNLNNPKDFVEKLRTVSLEFLTPLVSHLVVNIAESGHITFASKEQPNSDKKIESEELKAEKKEKKEKKEPKPKKDSGIVTEESKNEIQVEGLEIKGQGINPQRTARKFEIKFEKATCDDESFSMYQRYCKAIHGKEKESKSGYKDFLCLQSLEYSSIESQGKTLNLGCYHMKYYIDGKLIAIGVVDITKYTLSSVYFFYDPDYKNLSLGVVGGIKEIEYVKEMNKYFPDFKYYYLGYYIHNNRKMTYKADYEPAQLLCPITYTWVPLDDGTKKLCDKKEYRLATKDVNTIEDMDFSQSNVEKFVKEKVKIINQGTELKLVQFNKKAYDYFIEAFKDISQGLGKKLTPSVQFVSN